MIRLHISPQAPENKLIAVNFFGSNSILIYI